jgi:hypothetical protein
MRQVLAAVCFMVVAWFALGWLDTRAARANEEVIVRKPLTQRVNEVEDVPTRSPVRWEKYTSPFNGHDMQVMFDERGFACATWSSGISCWETK